MDTISKYRKYIIGAAVCFILTAILLFFILEPFRTPERTIHISYRIAIQNPTNQVIRNAALSVRAPLETTAMQKRLNISADPSYKLNQDQGTLFFEWDIIPPFTTKLVTVRSQVGLWKEPVKAGGADLRRYLLAEPTIEADHPEIKTLAGQLKGNSTQDSIRNIFDHVSEKIVHIGYVKRTRGALYAFKYGKGDCTEYAHLFVALCRASGIPARVVGGFVCPNSSTLDLGDFHNWAEFYHKGRWQIADPQMRKLMTDQNHYIAFQIFDPSGSDEGTVIADANPKELKVTLNH